MTLSNMNTSKLFKFVCIKGIIIVQKKKIQDNIELSNIAEDLRVNCYMLSESIMLLITYMYIVIWEVSVSK